MRSRGSAFFSFSAYATVAAALCACEGIDLQATTFGEPGQSNSEKAVKSPTFYVSGSQLRDPCAKPVLLRGVNEMVTYLPSKSGAAAFKEIAKTNANSVRIYWRTSDSGAELDTVLRDAEANRLIPVVYVFNGAPDQERFVETSLMDAVTYWTRSDVAPVIEAHKSWLLIALREKSSDSSASVGGWASRYRESIARMRSAGILLPLAIDAPLEGSNIQTLLDSGRDLIATDTTGNLMLNVNLGLANDSADSPDTLAAQLGSAAALELPMLIGEISGYSHRSDYSCGDPYAFATVLDAAQKSQTGWLAWSWGAAPNKPCSDLDMAPGGVYDSLGGWGREVARSDPNSIEHTSLKPQYAPGVSCE